MHGSAHTLRAPFQGDLSTQHSLSATHAGAFESQSFLRFDDTPTADDDLELKHLHYTHTRTHHTQHETEEDAPQTLDTSQHARKQIALP
jgi:hypothetical protein